MLTVRHFMTNVGHLILCIKCAGFLNIVGYIVGWMLLKCILTLYINDEMYNIP